MKLLKKHIRTMDSETTSLDYAPPLENLSKEHKGRLSKTKGLIQDNMQSKLFESRLIVRIASRTRSSNSSKNEKNWMTRGIEVYMLDQKENLKKNHSWFKTIWNEQENLKILESSLP